MNIGNEIKQARIMKGFTQQKLAEEIDKTVSSIKKYESGYTSPPINVLNKIAVALGVTINDLTKLGDEYSRATSLSDTYYNSVMKWSEDRVFNDMETICIREHFFDLLLRYKELIESLSNSKYTWKNVGESQPYINKDDAKTKELFLNQELERQINDLVNWVKAFPNWMVRRENELSNNNEIKKTKSDGTE